jgi:uncharacterized oligopeptide transporter (OPT) family protein
MSPSQPEMLPVASAEDEHERAAREWLANVYQGDTVRQLSVRSIVTGMIIGGVMSISNLYVGLKTGWGLGVTITACIIAYAVFKALEAIIPSYRRDPFTILENYTMSSAASAAGYMASAGLVSAFPALYLTTGRMLTWWEMMIWLGAVSVLGVFMAVPLKRQLINIDQLPFPTGIATAETLKSMHTEGREAMRKATALLTGGVIGAVVALWRDGLPAFAGWIGTRFQSPGFAESLTKLAFPSSMPLAPIDPARRLLERQTIGLEGSLIMIAAGAIMGIRVGVSLLIGALIYYGVIGKFLLDNGTVEPGYKGIVSWTLWPATAMMVASGLLSFGLRWRTVLRAFRGLTAVFSNQRKPNDPLESIEVPGSWFVVGVLLAGIVCVVFGHLRFEITWWMGIVAVLVTFMLSIVAARATGETDVTPIGAMGKITQLMYGIIAPSNMTTNLMTASITAGAASHSADLLTDLKSGYLLGGNPRKQTISQLFGVLAGTLVCVPVYAIIVKPEELGSEKLPAPAAKVWAGVAEMMAKGPGALPAGALTAMAIGAAIGIAITLLEEFSPKRFHKWIPSATGLGIAGVIPAFNSISMFLGAFVAWTLSKSRPTTSEVFTIPVSSGLIAGESLMGVAIILAMEGPGMFEALKTAFSG